MTEKFIPESRETPKTEPKLINLTELYEGGKADISKISEYVEIARQKGITDAEQLDLTGGTMMAIYAAVAAEAGKPGSRVKEFAFNNPGREGRLILWSPKIAQSVSEKPTKPLMVEVPPSTIDPEAPQEVLDLRLTFADNPEAMQQMADPKKAAEYAKEIIAQIRELKEKGVDTIRITGIPMWLAQAGYFIGAREGIKRLISYTLSSEMIIYDAENPALVGKVEIKTPKDVVVNLSDKEITDMALVRSGRELQKTLGIDLSRNKIKLTGVDLNKIPPHIALRIFDSIHSFSSSLELADVEIFQHLDQRAHEMVPKTKERNPELLPKEQRIPLTLNVHAALKRNEDDAEKTALGLAKEAVNKASELTFLGISNELELAIAGKVAHAAHGLIEELRYQSEEREEVVKSWKPE